MDGLGPLGEVKATFMSKLLTEEKEFKISARRNKYLGEWGSKIMGYSEEQTKEYIQSVIKADFAEAGDEDVFRKIKSELELWKFPKLPSLFTIFNKTRIIF